MMRTPEATLGPFFPPQFSDAEAADLARAARGEKIEIRGCVTQADGAALSNLVVEIWQADAAGIYRHPADPRHRDADPGFAGWGRSATGADGVYAFRTVLPGAPAGRAPHVNFMLMYSGLMRILRTTLFFSDAADPVLAAVPPARRRLLIATAEGPGRFRFDIRLRGENETPFFED